MKGDLRQHEVMTGKQASKLEGDRPFCFLFRFSVPFVSPGFHKQNGHYSVRGPGGPSTPGAKSGLHGCQAPLRAGSTNLCPACTSQDDPPTDRHSSKCRATPPPILGQHS